MDISLREWLILVGLLVVVAILVHGYLHMRKMKQLGVSEFSGVSGGDDCNGELPNGGARVIGEDAEERVEPTLGETSSEYQSESDQPVPVLMDSYSEPKELDSESFTQTEESQTSLAFEMAEDEKVEANPVDVASETSETMDSPAGLSEISAQSEDVLLATSQENSGSSGEQTAQNETSDDIQFSFEQEAAPQPSMSPRRQQLQKLCLVEDHSGPTEDPERVFMLHVSAKEGSEFNCGRLVDVAGACGMRFGKMDIFHRHQEDNGHGKVQFSMVSAIQPGCFDLDNVDDQFTPGVTFFMSLPGPVNNIQAFDYMFETAKVIANNMGGEVKDEQQSVMTAQTAEHIRQQILDYERKRRLSKMSH